MQVFIHVHCLCYCITIITLDRHHNKITPFLKSAFATFSPFVNSFSSLVSIGYIQFLIWTWLLVHMYASHCSILSCDSHHLTSVCLWWRVLYSFLSSVSLSSNLLTVREEKTETHTFTQRTDGAVELQTALLMMRRPLWSSSIHFRNSVKHNDEQVLKGPLCEAQKDLMETSYGTGESSCFWTTMQTLFIWKLNQGKLTSHLLSRLSCTSFDVRITDKSGQIHLVLLVLSKCGCAIWLPD